MKPDLTPSEIRFLLNSRGYTYAKLEREFGLKNMTASKASRVPHPQGEKAIAKILGVAPENIWPSRYDKQGNRLDPQPTYKYITENLKDNVKNERHVWTKEVKDAS